MYKNVVLPTILLAETIIGAGMFALPYVFMKAGVLTGAFFLIFLGLAAVITHLMYADIVVRTPQNHRFVGYAKIYLGKAGFWLGFLINIVGALFGLTIYLILSASFIDLIGGTKEIGLPVYGKILIFWILGSVTFFININRLAFSEFLTFAFTAVVIFGIFAYGFFSADFNPANIFLFNADNFFLPYGLVLFSLAGATAVPTVLGYFRNNGKPSAMAKTPIIVGSLAPALIYLFFVFGVLFLSDAVSEDSVSGLIGRLPPFILWVLGVLGAATLWSTYVVIGRNIKKTLEHDLSLGHYPAGLAVSFLPLLFYFSGFQNFLSLAKYIGGVFIGLEGILIILIWQKAFKTQTNGLIGEIRPIIVYGLLFVFAGGIVYTLLY